MLNDPLQRATHGALDSPIVSDGTLVNEREEVHHRARKSLASREFATSRHVPLLCGLVRTSTLRDGFVGHVSCWNGT